MTDTSAGGAAIANFRDVGGLESTAGAVMRPGVLFRSASIPKLDDAAAQLLSQKSITQVLDLRTGAERGMAPDVLPTEVSLVTLDVLGSDPTSAAASLTSILANPDKAKALTATDAKAMLEASYRSFINLESATSAYRQMYSLIADSAPAQVHLFHCTAGKDRTGWGAAALQLWLGVPEATVYEEYLRSNAELGDQLQPIIDWFISGGGSAEAIRALMAVEPEYLDAALDEVRSSYGDIDGYFTRGLGLSSQQLKSLWTRFLTD